MAQGRGSASRKQKRVRMGCHVLGGFPLAGSPGPLALMGSRDLGVEIPSSLLLHSCCPKSSPQLPPLLSPSPCFLCPVCVLPKPPHAVTHVRARTPLRDIPGICSLLSSLAAQGLINSESNRTASRLFPLSCLSCNPP